MNPELSRNIWCKYWGYVIIEVMGIKRRFSVINIAVDAKLVGIYVNANELTNMLGLPHDVYMPIVWTAFLLTLVPGILLDK